MPRSLIQVVLVAAIAVLITGCGTVSGSLRAALTAGPETPPATETSTAQNFGSRDEPTRPVTHAGTDEATRTDATKAAVVDLESAPLLLVAADYRLDAEPSPDVLLAQAAAQSTTATDAIEEEYDPWEPFNEKMFEFNRRLDRYVLKPIAKGYDVVVPDRVQAMIANAFDNIHFVPRMMNSLFQGKFDGAVREFGRFLFNSTIGIGGLFDVAKIEGIEKSREDFGQTLGFYGVGPGPYLILPFFEPLTVRDGIGKGIDGLMDPMSYFVPFIWERLVMKIGETVNDRALNLELFQGFEESVIDMYSAVRHGYLKRREKLIKE